MFNAYLPHPDPMENRPEEAPPGGSDSGADPGKPSLLGSLLGKLSLGGLDRGDLILLLILYLVLKENEESDPVLLLTLGLAFLLPP